jgi:pyridoxal/pyridoxine/pyridoxamine kinase
MFTSCRKRSLQATDKVHNVDQMADVQDGTKSEAFIDEQYILYTPRLAGQFTGTGDVCAALFLGLTSDHNQVENIREDCTSLAFSLEQLAGTFLPATYYATVVTSLTRCTSLLLQTAIQGQCMP